MKKTISAILFALVSVMTYGQQKDWGRVSASLESTHHMYVADQPNGFDPSNLMQLSEDGIYATNNYLKVDYYNVCPEIITGYFFKNIFKFAII